MLRSELPNIPVARDAVISVVEQAKAEQQYPEIFDESRLLETLQTVIERTRLPLDSALQRRAAQRKCAYQLGLYMQDHELL